MKTTLWVMSSLLVAFVLHEWIWPVIRSKMLMRKISRTMRRIGKQENLDKETRDKMLDLADKADQIRKDTNFDNVHDD